MISAIAACQLAARAGSGRGAPDDGLLHEQAAEALAGQVAARRMPSARPIHAWLPDF